MSQPQRRLILTTVGSAAVIAVCLAGCSSPSGEATEEDVTLRMVWWGDDVRADATNAAIDLFEEEHPNITVEPESLPFDGYFDRLSTQVAANDAPDVQQLAIDFIADYGTRGALLDLADVDTENLDSATTEAANVDGEQWGVASGLATQVVVANKTLFDQAGVELPDDETWTWDDYIEIASEISANSADGVFGAAPLGMDAASFQTFIRQAGGAPYDDEGAVDFTADDVELYLDLTKQLQDSGGSSGPEVASEQVALPLEQTGTALNTFGMGLWASGQFTALVQSSGQELVPLRIPSLTGEPGDSFMATGVSQYWSASSRTEHPAEAQMLVDFIVNSEEAGAALGLSRGTPPNSVVAEALTADLADADATITTFVTDVGGESVVTPLPPAGFGSFQDVFRRYVAEYMFGRQSASDAANGLVEETSTLLGG